ncbi:hypothetical protein [Mongoliibacter ruber]|uniref:Uncharacterized protein n=1 Tax=Mongoliibacter ruber TaxID=1750599 RepID=A0A2T0WH23_9BACT|nr:hypothetical protein [Mongoliibacter ruber]PRY85955.1 hypothetical protein CLW00_11086 [Mongoliibacter ruber]
MGVAELKLKLHQTIDSIDDKDKLEALYILLKDTKSKYASMNIKDYINAIDEAIAQIKAGDFSLVEDFEKESENW